MKISIITVCLNSEKSIEKTIKSIISQQPLSASEDLYIKVLRGADKATYSELNKDILNALEAQK